MAAPTSRYLCLQMLILVAGAFQVQGPREPAVAMLGGEAELTCFLLPAQNVKNMQISWSRSLPSQVVHLYKNGRDQPDEAMEEYLGRTELVRHVMYKGIVVLRIHNVRTSDNGQYRCEFQHGSSYSNTVMELKVAVLGSNPHFHVEVTTSLKMQLVCKSEGWFPQPRVQWIDSEGGEIPAESETHTQDKDGLFHITTSLLFRKTSQKNLICSVWNPVLHQKKEEQLFIAVTMFSTSLIIAIAVLAALLLIFIITGLLLCRKWHKHRESSSQSRRQRKTLNSPPPMKIMNSCQQTEQFPLKKSGGLTTQLLHKQERDHIEISRGDGETISWEPQPQRTNLQEGGITEGPSCRLAYPWAQQTRSDLKDFTQTIPASTTGLGSNGLALIAPTSSSSRFISSSKQPAKAALVQVALESPCYPSPLPLLHRPAYQRHPAHAVYKREAPTQGNSKTGAGAFSPNSQKQTQRENQNEETEI